MAGELAVAYVSLTAETSKIPKQIESAVKQGARGAESVGRGLGSKLASGIGSTLKAGFLAAGAVAGLALSTALNQGMKRLVSIDEAKAKLAGLGHTAEGVAGIMDSALAAVKGTAFGLGEAATIAASAVAAGVQPGQELTKYLTLTADAATIAGTSLEDMGSILNKVQTSGKVFTDNLNQLSDRGIPIFQWLQDEYKVSAVELSKMVEDGKVDSETFKRVIEKNIGGAAQNSGKTLKGSIANMKAAFGRLGEGILTPFLQDSKGGLGKFTEFLDRITPKAKEMSQALHDGLGQMAAAFKSSGAGVDDASGKWEKFGAKAREVSDALKRAFTAIKEGRISDAFSGLTSGSDGMGQATGEASKLGDAFGKVSSFAKDAGVSLLDLAGNTGGVLTTAIRGASTIMGFFADHTALATTALAGLAAGFAIAQTAETAWQIAKVVSVVQLPAQLLVQRQLTAALIAHTAALQANTVAQGGNAAATNIGRLAQLGAATAHFRASAAAAASTTSLAAFATAQRTAAASSGAFVGAMRNTVAGVANLGARAQGAATAGLGALRSGIGKVASAIGPGGALTIGLIATVAAFSALSAGSSRFNDDLEASATSSARFGASMDEFKGKLAEAFSDSGGKIDNNVKTLVSDQIKAIDDEVAAAAQRIPSNVENIGATFSNLFHGNFSDAFSSDGLGLVAAGAQAEALQGALDKLGISTKDIGNAAVGSASQWGELKDKLSQLGPQGADLIAKYQAVRDEFIRSHDAANNVKDAFLGIKEGALGASDGVGAMTSALARLRGDATSVDDAQQQVNATLRAFADAAKEGGIATADVFGNIDTRTAQGAALRDAVKGVATAFDTAGAAAAAAAAAQNLSAEDTAASVEAAGQRVRDEFIRQAIEAGATEQQATALADQYKLFPKELPTLIKLAGDVEAKNKLDELAKPATKVITVQTLDPETGNAGALSIPDRPGLGSWQHRADGGALTGGVPGKDSIPILGMPGEHMLDTGDVDRLGGQGGVYRFRAALKAGLVGRFAEGGAVERALGAARAATGTKYLWGGTTPAGFDCSGFMGYLQQILMGIAEPTKRLYTTMSLLGGQTAGLLSGSGAPGTIFRVGVSNEHMAGTLAGRPVESGGSHGDSRLGPPAVGADDGQFASQFYLPNNLIAGSVGKKADWSQAEEIDLERAKLALEKAKAAQAEVAKKPDATEFDRRDAELDVKDAQDKLTTLENKKAGIGSEFDTTTDLSDDKDKTDKPGEAEKAFDLKGRLRDFVTDAAGIGFDALAEQLPFGLGQSRWVTTDWSQFSKKPDAKKALSDKPPSFPKEDVFGQFGFDASKGVPDWVEQLRKASPLKVFDSGGVMNPGDIGINLLKQPEAWLDPAQMANVERIANLDTLAPAAIPMGGGYDGPQIVVKAYGSDAHTVAREVMSKLNFAQMRYGGRAYAPS